MSQKKYGVPEYQQTTTRPNPDAGFNKLYFKADNELYKLDSSGNEVSLTDAMGGVVNNSVDSEHIVDGSIDTIHLADDLIDGSKIADSVIDSEHYVDGSIDRAHLADDIIDSTKLADDAINSEHIVDGSIDTVHISDGAITTAKIVDDSVTTDKINDAAVTTSKIEDSAIVTAKIANDAIDGSKIADNVINSEHYVDGSIDTIHIGDDQVTFDKIENINSGTIVGRIDGGSGSATDLTPAALGLASSHTGNTVAPGIGDDLGSGYNVGDMWIDETGNQAYVCVDSTNGAAVWGVLGGNAAPSGVAGTGIYSARAATLVGIDADRSIVITGGKLYTSHTDFKSIDLDTYGIATGTFTTLTAPHGGVGAPFRLYEYNGQVHACRDSDGNVQKYNDGAGTWSAVGNLSNGALLEFGYHVYNGDYYMGATTNVVKFNPGTLTETVLGDLGAGYPGGSLIRGSNGLGDIAYFSDTGSNIAGYNFATSTFIHHATPVVNLSGGDVNGIVNVGDDSYVYVGLHMDTIYRTSGIGASTTSSTGGTLYDDVTRHTFFDSVNNRIYFYTDDTGGRVNVAYI